MVVGLFFKENSEYKYFVNIFIFKKIKLKQTGTEMEVGARLKLA